MTAERGKLNLIAACGMLLLAVLLAQTTLLAGVRLLGYTPVMTLACTVCVALFEGEEAGALFGLFLGFGMDATVGSTVGLGAVRLLLAGYLVGYVARTLVLRSGISAFVLYAACHGGNLAVDLLLRLLVTGDWQGYWTAVADHVTAAVFSALWLLLFYPLARVIHARFGEES